MVDRAENAVGFSFPDLPGCVAQGATIEKAYDLAVAALAEWITDEAANGRRHAPRSLNEVTEDDDVLAAIGDGAAVAFVPLVRMTGRPVKANLSFDEGLLAEIDESAAPRLKLNRSAWLSSAAREALKRGA